jgi:hypothetical protein
MEFYDIVIHRGQYYLTWRIKPRVGHLENGLVIGLPTPTGEVQVGETLQYHYSWSKKMGTNLEEMEKEYAENWKHKIVEEKITER